MPASEFQIYISSADSGIDSDTSPTSSPTSSTKLTDSQDDIVIVNPEDFLRGKGAGESERINGISQSLAWLKEELENMKIKDRHLAKTMITIRSRIAEYKNELERQDTGYDSD